MKPLDWSSIIHQPSGSNTGSTGVRQADCQLGGKLGDAFDEIECNGGAQSQAGYRWGLRSGGINDEQEYRYGEVPQKHRVHGTWPVAEKKTCEWQ